MAHSPLHSAEYFVGPRKAFQIVGQEFFGDAWREDCIDNPVDDDHHKTLELLRQALRSGDVSAHWSTHDLRRSGDLRPQDADQEFFRIMLREDFVFHQGLNEPVYCKIHAGQLRRLLLGTQLQPVTPTKRAKIKCFEWLLDFFSDREHEVPPFAELRRTAKEKFPGLSDLAFKEARKLAIEKTGRDDLARPGRRRNPIGE